MSVAKRPLIDQRTRQDIIRQLTEQIATTTDWDPAQDTPDGIHALIEAAATLSDFARAGLERSLERHELTFLDLIGTPRRAAMPARVPLTFTPATGTQRSVVVHKGTRVSAPPPNSDDDPISFETDETISLATAHPRWVVLHDPQSGIAIDVSGVLRGESVANFAQLQEPHEPAARRIYVGCGSTEIDQIRLVVTGDDPSAFWTWQRLIEGSWTRVDMVERAEFSTSTPDTQTKT